MSIRSRRRLNTTLDESEHAALGANPGRTIGMLARALAAGDVLRLEQHYAATDAAREDAASRSGSHAANVRHHGEPYALDAWPTPDERTP